MKTLQNIKKIFQDKITKTEKLISLKGGGGKAKGYGGCPPPEED